MGNVAQVGFGKERALGEVNPDGGAGGRCLQEQANLLNHLDLKMIKKRGGGVSFQFPNVCANRMSRNTCKGFVSNGFPVPPDNGLDCQMQRELVIRHGLGFQYNI